jgi:hypothetical protein
MVSFVPKIPGCGWREITDSFIPLIGCGDHESIMSWSPQPGTLRYKWINDVMTPQPGTLRYTWIHNVMIPTAWYTNVQKNQWCHDPHSLRYTWIHDVMTGTAWYSKEHDNIWQLQKDGAFRSWRSDNFEHILATHGILFSSKWNHLIVNRCHG